MAEKFGYGDTWSCASLEANASPVNRLQHHQHCTLATSPSDRYHRLLLRYLPLPLPLPDASFITATTRTSCIAPSPHHYIVAEPKKVAAVAHPPPPQSTSSPPLHNSIPLSSVTDLRTDHHHILDICLLFITGSHRKHPPSRCQPLSSFLQLHPSQIAYSDAIRSREHPRLPTVTVPPDSPETSHSLCRRVRPPRLPSPPPAYTRDNHLRLLIIISDSTTPSVVAPHRHLRLADVKHQHLRLICILHVINANGLAHLRQPEGLRRRTPSTVDYHQLLVRDNHSADPLTSSALGIPCPPDCTITVGFIAFATTARQYHLHSRTPCMLHIQEYLHHALTTAPHQIEATSMNVLLG